MRTPWKYLLLLIALEAVPASLLVEMHMHRPTHQQQAREVLVTQLSISEEPIRPSADVAPDFESLLNE
jgi:hypothetical protein